MNPFLFYFIASMVISFAWTILAMLGNQGNRQFLGLAGTWAGALVLAAIWRADVLPWVSQLIQIVMLAWLSAITVLAISATTTWSHQQRLRLPLVACAAISLFINVSALLHFLWIATVSPAGV